MANKPINRLQVRRTLLLLISGRSERGITKDLGISRNTVSKYLEAFNRSGKSFEDLLALRDDEL
jgi:transposase